MHVMSGHDETLFCFGINLLSYVAGHASPDLAIRSSPPVEQPKPRSRKRKLLIDETIVLTNQYVRTSSIFWSNSSFDTWLMV